MESNTSWLELNTIEPEMAIEFYSNTLGWDFEPTQLPQGGDYWVAKHNDQPVGGIFSLGDDTTNSIPSHWMTYMQVENIHQAQEAARRAGGNVSRPVLQLDGVGKLLVITDSQEAMIGLIEIDAKFEGKVKNYQ